jgi:hypothetical protein
MSRSGARRFSSLTVPASGGRASVSRSANEAVPALNASIASPIGSRSLASPVTRSSSLSIEADRLPSSSDSVRSTVRRLSTACWMTALRSASAFVNDEVLVNSDSSVSP